MSQMALANQVGLHPTYVSGIERGERNVSLVNIWLIADGLGVTPGVLFEE
jgi:transcriptional regulator with XRE-family HTH domain